MNESVSARTAGHCSADPAHCPPWCADCNHDLGPPGAVLHRSPPAVVALYDEGCDLVAAYVRAAFWAKTPDWLGTDPADLERPHVEVRIPDISSIEWYLTAGQARAFAAALSCAADAADTEAAHRMAVTPSPLPAGASASVLPGQA